LKNQAERLCFEADKELELFKSNISKEKEEKIRSLIQKVKGLSENDDINSLSAGIEELKSEMKEMVTSPDPLVNDPSGSNSMSDLNDL
jgi:molecular chaperone DnaK (HSP70)